MIEVIEYAALEGGKVLSSYFEKGIKARHKTSHHDLVTAADLLAQEKIVESLTRLLKKRGIEKKDIGFIGEEELYTPSLHTFVMDPLDGTTNFESGIGLFVVAIAYFYKDTLTASVIYNPIDGALYYAQAGHGAYRIKNGVKKKLSVEPYILARCLLGTYIATDSSGRGSLVDSIRKLYHHIKGIRILGSASVDLCYVADNKLDIVTHRTTRLWDVAPGELILRESGGIVVDLHGREFSYNLKDYKKFYPILATHPKLLPEILKVM